MSRRQQKPVIDRNQSRVVVAVQDILSLLMSELSDVKHFEIEPHAPFEDEELPGLAIFLGFEEVINIDDAGHEVEPLELDSDGNVVGNNPLCCHREYTMRQEFYVEIISKQCNGAYAVVERLLHEAKLLIGSKGYADITYDGSGNYRAEENLSTNYYARSARYFITHTYNTGLTNGYNIN